MKILLSSLLWIALAVPAAGQGRTNLKVDLIQASINGRSVLKMGVDDVTSLLGRPTAVKDNRIIADVIGPNIYYHDVGLSFSFKGNKSDTAGKILTMVVYFSRAWDQESKQFFAQFSGDIPQKLNANWTAQKTAAEFAAYNPIVLTPEEVERQWKEAGLGFNPRVPSYHLVRLKLDGFDLNVIHDSVSKFLERASIASNR